MATIELGHVIAGLIHSWRNRPWEQAMKQRVLVMNGQRLLQNELLGKWVVAKVDKAGALKPGIYNIYCASDANKKIIHTGLILHVNEKFVYQQINNTIVRHVANDFQNFPTVGDDVKIGYANKVAVIESAVTIRSGHRVRR